MSEPEKPSDNKNFLEKKIDGDLLPGGRSHGKTVTTRFPPEPNGYLHIGHAKSVLLNFGLALQYNGQCNLRFDDTNPVTEETEYVESIESDVEWISSALDLPWVVNEGKKPWRDNLFFASDYFPQFYEYAKELVLAGKAYVDSQTPEQVKAGREGEGTDSPFRNRTIEENMKLLEEMKDGKHEEGTQLLRAKIDMHHDNFVMRDPPLYRIKKVAHHRTGEQWCIYPMYDFAHGQEDAIEHITHSICTLEFENRNMLYQWFINNIPSIPSHPVQTEFARLNIEGFVTSKRKLLRLVNEKKVMGWDDPRMPTISGLRRRGVRPHGIKKFCDAVGVTNVNSLQPAYLLDELIRLDLDPIVHRRMVVVDPIRVEITTYPEGESEELPNCENQAFDKNAGSRSVSFSRNIFIDRDDFQEDAPKDFYRFSKVGGEVKLRFSYVIKLDEIEKDAEGNVVLLKCSHDPTTRDTMPKDRKVKGVIHWVDAATCVDSEVRIINPLFKPFPEDGEYEMMDYLNPDSMQVFPNAKAERSLEKEILDGNQMEKLPSGAEFYAVKRYQFERKGFFASDRDSAPGKLVFNRIVQLKESTVKKNMTGTNTRSRKDEQAAQKAEKERLRAVPPSEYFKQGEYEGMFSKFDESGFPTHEADGKEVTKSAAKKLKKKLEKHEKLYAAYLAEQEGK